MSPIPAAPARKPKPKAPAPNVTVASTTSETLIAAFPNIAMLQATSTASSAGERRTALKPAARSWKWPLESAWADCSARCGIRASSSAETPNVTAFTQ